MTSASPTVLLDLDGTLVDSEPGIVSSCRVAIESLGLVMPGRNDIARLIGPPISDVMAYLLEGQGEGRVEEAVAAYREDYGRRGILDCTPYPGIAEALGALHAGGARLVLATSKRRDFAVSILDRIGLAPLFSAVYGSGLGATSAHKDAMIAGIVRDLALDPAEAVMVGDRRFDIAGAHANAIRALGVLWGYGSEAELVEAGADRIIAETRELTRGTIAHTLGRDG